MKIRSVLSAAVLAVATTFAATQALAQDKFTLKMAETWGPNFPIFGDTTKRFAETVEKMSNGRLTVRIDSANKHKAPLGVFDMVKAGQYDLGHSASYYWKGKVPETLFFTSMPFGMNAMEQYAWFYHGGGMELMQEVYEPHNMLSFPGGNTGVQMGGWFRKEIKSLDDLKGLKMRIPGFAGEVFAEVGVNPTNIAPGELYTALERNTIDAVEWVGPALDLRLGFQQIADYYYTGWHEPATELQFLVNKRVWDRLPADLQEIMRVAMRTASYDMLVHSQHANAEAWANIKEQYPNVQIKQFPEDIFQAMYDANKKLLKEAAERNDLSARIVESQETYLRQSRAYTDISERAYLNTMAEVE
ncbi:MULTISPECIES: TRAP transporter substrate-binding protein [Marinobacter]|uniref:ABC transporter substrate-binding protein n=1 Tax=Marinobacter nauticus TaxID=2743 RepID=A0A1M2UUW2_MARNT|nr:MULTISPECIES: TRAP transporter substrate-binding protein [Marinobacter]OJS99124.1 ABC transporter substrate-binding protein [Marinobacter nauticus]QFS88566.1 Monocarboxylate 2-oxoacid-binding periplasmic protein precursor [Marinobacter sp. THAF197a]QFT52351.1 Monocarboxylate 2-oxoacid-binding periplasmic protein precursor [Marinobacter sp. THAF39]BBJ05664.1 ABC transporter substrate-binding protein [Marinobacter nauticus]